MNFALRGALVVSVLLMICRASVAFDAVDVTLRRDQPPKLDGRVSDDEKMGASPITMTVLGSLDKPKYPTSVYMAFYQEGFYAGFVVTDPDPQNLVTRIKDENGPVFTDDSVQLLICPRKEVTRRNYLHFALNAAGVRYSMDMDRDSPVAGWESAVQKTSDGWEAEMFLPYDAIRGSIEQGLWRGNAARVRVARDGSPEETSVWANPGTTLHNFRRFGFMRIVDPLAPKPQRRTETTTEAAETTGPVF